LETVADCRFDPENFFADSVEQDLVCVSGI